MRGGVSGRSLGAEVRGDLVVGVSRCSLGMDTVGGVSRWSLGVELVGGVSRCSFKGGDSGWS